MKSTGFPSSLQHRVQILSLRFCPLSLALRKRCGYYITSLFKLALRVFAMNHANGHHSMISRKRGSERERKSNEWKDLQAISKSNRWGANYIWVTNSIVIIWKKKKWNLPILQYARFEFPFILDTLACWEKCNFKASSCNDYAHVVLLWLTNSPRWVRRVQAKKNLPYYPGK